MRRGAVRPWVDPAALSLTVGFAIPTASGGVGGGQVLAFRQVELSSVDAMVLPPLSLDMDLVPALKTLDSPLTAAVAAAVATERECLCDNDDGDNGHTSAGSISRPAEFISLRCNLQSVRQPSPLAR